MSGLPKYIYIVVAEGKRSHPCVAFESEHLDLQSAKDFQERIGGAYGKTSIYKAHKIKELKDERKRNSL